jgi:hypothetical protein
MCVCVCRGGGGWRTLTDLAKSVTGSTSPVAMGLVIITVRGPQSQRKSSSADAPLCKDREHKQRNLSSYCAGPQPLCSTSSGGNCATIASPRQLAHMPARAASESVDTTTHRTEKLASTPQSSLEPYWPRPPRPAGQRLGRQLAGKFVRGPSLRGPASSHP